MDENERVQFLPVISILPYILVAFGASEGKASEIEIESLAQYAKHMGLNDCVERLHFQLKVPTKPGEFVASPTQFINNVPFHLLLKRTPEMELVLFTSPARITAASIHMLWKRQIFCNGLEVVEEQNIAFEQTKAQGQCCKSWAMLLSPGRF